MDAIRNQFTARLKKRRDETIEIRNKLQIPHTLFDTPSVSQNLVRGFRFQQSKAGYAPLRRVRHLRKEQSGVDQRGCFRDRVVAQR